MTECTRCVELDHLEDRLEALVAMAREAELRATQFPGEGVSLPDGPCHRVGVIAAATVLSLLDPDGSITHGGTTATDLLDPDEGEPPALGTVTLNITMVNGFKAVASGKECDCCAHLHWRAEVPGSGICIGCPCKAVQL